MLEKDWHKDAVLLYIVVNDQMASKIIAEAKKHGIRGATVMLGRGTIKNKWLNATANTAMDALAKRFHFEKPNRGIAFAVEMEGIAGTSAIEHWPEPPADHAAQPAQWQLITTIVEHGRAEDVVEAAQSVGARGGTIIAGRGSGVAQTELVLGMEIEPEKDIVFMLAPAQNAPQIEEAIDQRLDLNKPNHGILFTQNVVAVSGLYQGA